MSRALVTTLPDLPRWVELRGRLLEGSAVVHGKPGRCVVRIADGPKLRRVDPPVPVS
jgi:hypothetical protein